MHVATTEPIPTPHPLSDRSPLTVALLGAGGHGRSHLRVIADLSTAREGRPALVELVAVADPAPPASITETLSADRVYASAADLFAAHSPDITIICTPINTHLELAELAFAHGSHVFLEKPTTPSLATFERLLAAAERSGLACQVGFQSLGSHALTRVRELVTSGELGTVRGIGAVGTWTRDEVYWARARWAGRRTLDGVPVVDGVVTNPLAHAVATALAVDGSTLAGDVTEVTTDLYRGNRIEADDTSSVRIRTRTGTVIALGLTLCAPVQTAPRIVVHGSAASATLFYTTDTVQIRRGAEVTTERHGRTGLLANLVDHIRDGAALLCPVQGTGAFMRVLDAVRAAPDPAEISPEHLTTVLPGAAGHPAAPAEPAPPATTVAPPVSPHIVVADVEHWCEQVAEHLETFTTLGAPWTVPSPDGPHRELATARVAGVEVARLVDGSGSRPSDSPRPHLHPVRTLAGVTVTDARPADHTWHAGAGIGVQDVDGNNLWGGRTYVRDHGYLWRDDHGSIRHDRRLTQDAEHVADALTWLAHDGSALVTERRTTRWWQLDEAAWALETSSTLTAAAERDVVLGSPGSNGRPGGGYGGFFWRVAPCTQIDVWSPDRVGEDAVHGSLAPWVAWQATATASGDGGDDGDDGVGGGAPFTLVFAAGDAPTAADPWVVRATSYPGVGSAIAWNRPTVLAPGAPQTRTVRVAVADGRLSRPRVEHLGAALAWNEVPRRR